MAGYKEHEVISRFWQHFIFALLYLHKIHKLWKYSTLTISQKNNSRVTSKFDFFCTTIYFFRSPLLHRQDVNNLMFCINTFCNFFCGFQRVLYCFFDFSLHPNGLNLTGPYCLLGDGAGAAYAGRGGGGGR